MPNTNSGQTVEAVNPKGLALGQIVPFESKITVNGSTSPENGTINMTFSWDTGGVSDFGFDSNYKIFAAFVDYGDGGNVDPEQDATVTNITNSPLNGTLIQETVSVTGLDSGDTIIVEIWVVLENALPISANGNVQTQLVSADTVSTPSANITKSAQTVPINQVKDFQVLKLMSKSKNPMHLIRFTQDKI